MQLFHTFSSMSVTADEPNLIGVAGLIPAVGLAQQLGVPQLLSTHVRLPSDGDSSAGANPNLKGMSLIAASRTTGVVDGIGDTCWIDIDDTVKGVYGRSKQGAEFGYTKVRGLNAQIATITTPETSPVIAAARLRGGQDSPDMGHLE